MQAQDAPITKTMENGCGDRIVYCVDSSGRKHGISKRYSASGKLLDNVNYMHGILHGELLEWSTNGTLTYKGLFVNGRHEGIHQRWSATGQLLERVAYVGGKMHGKMETYHLNGRPYEEGYYENGVRCGPYQFWDDAGKLRVKCTF